MIAAEGYEELMSTWRAHLGSLQVLEAVRRDYKQMEARTLSIQDQVLEFLSISMVLDPYSFLTDPDPAFWNDIKSGSDPEPCLYFNQNKK